MEYRNTKQKQFILDILHTTKSHPTIGEIYKEVKEKDSSIGQATVYRNINRLYKENKLVRISIHGIEHYDINKENHFHLYCKKCRKLYDIFDDDYFALISKIEKEKKLQIEHINTLLEGICEDCIDGKV